MGAATASARAASPATRPARRPAPRKGAPRRAAPATRRKLAAKRAPAPRLQPAGLIPSAVNRVGDLADCGLMVRITRSRAWIGVLAAMLAGIVTLNVVSLSYTSSSGRVAARSEALQRENALLRAKLTEDLSGPRIEAVAIANGLLVPDSGEIEYLSAGDQYAAAAARRIKDGLLTASSALAPVAPTPEPEVVPTSTPELAAPAPEVAPPTLGPATDPVPPTP